MDQQKNWEIIAKQITTEQDPTKLVELARQLIQALDTEMNFTLPEIARTKIASSELN